MNRALRRRTITIAGVAAAVLLVSTATASCSKWWTSGACPSAHDYGSTSRFASDNCIRRLFEPAKLALPQMSNYDRVYWEIERDPMAVSVHGQLVPRDRETGILVVFSAGFQDLGYVPDPGTEPQIISVPDTSQREQIGGVCVQFEGDSSAVSATWSAAAIRYNLEAISSHGETRSELEAALRPIVANLTDFASRNPAPWPTEVGLEDENLRQPAC
ncbi:MAG: hypothetical protein EPO22_03355 [Dehalococcoidia bacterium]|nr:MAG: hypothetical protein EPO22_03355 [Dehalococcoidia bacterium]